MSPAKDDNTKWDTQMHLPLMKHGAICLAKTLHTSHAAREESFLLWNVIPDSCEIHAIGSFSDTIDLDVRNLYTSGRRRATHATFSQVGVGATCASNVVHKVTHATFDVAWVARP